MGHDALACGPRLRSNRWFTGAKSSNAGDVEGPTFHEMSVTGSRPLDVHTKDLERSAESPPFGV